MTIITQNAIDQAMPVIPDDTDIIVECNTLDENTLAYILQLRMKHKKNCGICFDIRTETDGKRLIMMGNSLEIPVIARIVDRTLFNNLFHFWLEWKQIVVPVYPFSTIVQVYTACLLDKGFNPLTTGNVFSRYSLGNIEQVFINDAIEYLRQSNILIDCLKLVSEMLNTDEVITAIKNAQC